jgi:hypothetical protein
MFTPKVDSIVAQFQHIADQLDKAFVKNLQKYNKHQDKAAAHKAEADRAERIREKLEDLLA